MDNKIKKITIPGMIVFATVLLITGYIDNKNDININNDSKLENVLTEICGVESVKVMYYYGGEESNNRVSGVAVVYEGINDKRVVEEIYSLINALYDIPYNRIYVSH